MNLPKVELKLIPVEKIVTLKRNPQYLTPKQMDSLKKSTDRDGFVVPILVRPIAKGKFEVASGNHRFMAANELGVKEVPCAVAKMSDATMKRLAVNLNLIHGEPPVELLAPFLAELDSGTLSEIHLEEGLIKELEAFDTTLKDRLGAMEIPDSIDSESPQATNQMCSCPNCGKKHFKPEV